MCLVLLHGIWHIAVIAIKLTWVSWRFGGGVNFRVKGDSSSLFTVGHAVGMSLTRLHDIPSRGNLVVQGEVTGTGGLQGDLCFLSYLDRNRFFHD